METKIRLQTSRLLNSRFGLSTDNLEEKFEAVNTVFLEKEKQILDGLEKVTGLVFLKNYIDVFLINQDGKPSISFPPIVKIKEDISETICVIVHELIHNLMWDNVQNDNWSKKAYTLFEGESKKAAIHVAVHAIMEALYNDILNEPQVIERDIEIMNSLPDYKRAWEIVKKEGYKNIIEKLKSGSLLS